MVEVKEVGEIYKCEICGNVVEVKEVGGGELVCCDQPMVKVAQHSSGGRDQFMISFRSAGTFQS